MLWSISLEPCLLLPVKAKGTNPPEYTQRCCAVCFHLGKLQGEMLFRGPGELQAEWKVIQREESTNTSSSSF